MKILVISTCKEKLSENEFVLPIIEIIKSYKFDIVDYTNVDSFVALKLSCSVSNLVMSS